MAGNFDRLDCIAQSLQKQHASDTREGSIFASKTFKFIIQGQPLYIHADLVGRLSKPLDRMINGRMSEAVNEVASLEDVETETFVRFMQWAYTGSYHVGGNNNNNNNNNNTNNSSDLGAKSYNDVRESALDEEPAGGWQLPSSLIREPTPPRKAYYGRMKKRNPYGEDDFFSRSPLENLRKAFCERDYPVPETSLVETSPSCYNNYDNNNNNNNNSNSNSNRDLGQDYHPDVFLLHAKLFVFAEKYDIQPLKMQAIHNLHHSLSHFQLLLQHVSDIANLIHYSYENTQSSDDLLRELLASYVELEMAVLIEAKPFGELLEEGGDFVGDFLKRVKKRIS